VDDDGQLCYSRPGQFFVESAGVRGIDCILASVSAGDPTQVIPLPDHGFIIAWGTYGIHQQYQVFDASGTPVGTIQNGSPPHARDVALIGGGYVSLVAQGNPLMFQLRSSDGTPIGPATAVGDTRAVDAQIVPLAGGGFAIAWVDLGASTPLEFRVVSRMFTADGTPVGGPVVATSGTTRFALAPMDDGGYLVAWSKVDGTFVRRFRPDGTPGAAVGELSKASPYEFVIVANGEPDHFVAAWAQTSNGITSLTPLVFDATPLR